jgi:hypoxanthine-DNA glycosylase
MVEFCKSFKPISTSLSKVLIAGSFPGEQSLRQQQYYAHAQNSFWRIMADTFDQSVPAQYAGKKKMLMVHHVALWDVVSTCRRRTSSDALITDIQSNDIAGFLHKHPHIRTILFNGRKAEELFKRYFGDTISMPYVYLPSTSPAFASVSYAKKQLVWSEAVHKALR